MLFTKREMQVPDMPNWVENLTKNALIAGGAALLFAWLGVYNTGQFAFPARFLFWAATIFTGVSTAAVVVPYIVNKWMFGAHPVLLVAVAAVVTSLPVTLLLVGINRFGFDEPVTVPLVATSFFYVVVVSGIFSTAGYYISQLRRARELPDESEKRSGSALLDRFRDRLPVSLRMAEIYAASAEDHYLRIHTSAGEEMILMRLSDAVDELVDLDGLRTHRSWWVAKNGVAEIIRENGKVNLSLKSGGRAPVSRTHQKAVVNWLVGSG